LQVAAGWSAILRLPQTAGGGGDVAEELLRQVGLVVHPGSFYGIGEAGRVVVSLIGLSAEFSIGMQKISAVRTGNRIR
jgi:alanine-synthesizing transaminase